MPSASESREKRRREEQTAQLQAKQNKSMQGVETLLQTWTSSRSTPARSPGIVVGNRTYSSPLAAAAADTRRQDDVLWMKQQLQEDEEPDNRNSSRTNTSMQDVTMQDISPYTAGAVDLSQMDSTVKFAPTTPANLRSLERADTPVMSNSKREEGALEPPASQQQQAQRGLYSSARKVTRSQNTTATPSPNIHTPAARSTARGARRTPYHRWGAEEQPQLSMEDRHAVQICQRYHDTLWHYLQAKRQWMSKYQLAAKSSDWTGALVTMDTEQEVVTTTTSPNEEVERLNQEHLKLQVDYLQGLSSLCYEYHHVVHRGGRKNLNEQQEPSREGNFWNLLGHLRRLGMDALLWPNEDTTMLQQHMTLLEQLEHMKEENGWTPLELLEKLQNDSSLPDMEKTGLMQRRYQLLAWLHDCFRQEVPLNLKKTGLKENLRPEAEVTYDTNSELYRTQGLPETDKDASLMRQSLSLVLAGRVSQAQDLMRANGLSWRACVWGAGKPAGYQVKHTPDGASQTVSVGNPNRALWQHTMWRLTEESTRASYNEEKAIASLLCNNVEASLENPTLRTWEKAFYAGLKAMVGRTEDELLYQKDNSKFARYHLEATSSIAEVDEEQFIGEALARTPFPEMEPGNNLFLTATAAFLIGRESVRALLQQILDIVQDDDETDRNTLLRFATHMILYLESTIEDPINPTATTFISFELNQIRDRIVVEYIQSLSERELWNFMVLYASLLPNEVMLQHLPPLLVPVVNLEDRQTVVAQLHEIQPTLELPVLRAVVDQYDRHALLIQQRDEEEQDMLDEGRFQENEILSGGDNDERMMGALLWLCCRDEHAQEALVYSNKLIRQFLLQEKLDTVFYFVQEVRPDLVNKIQQSDSDDQEMLDQEDSRNLEVALSEHEMYESYLEAERAFSSWKNVMRRFPSVPSVQSLASEKNLEQWNEVERQIAIDQERRTLVQETQKLSTQIMAASERARQALVKVLRHPGGFLRLPGMDDDEEENDSEWESLRKQVLPHLVMLHGQVCQMTAEWLAHSLEHAASRLTYFASQSNSHKPTEEISMADALAALDTSVSPSPGGSAGETILMEQSLYSPTFWTTHAMELADTLANEEFQIPIVEETMGEMAKLAIVHMQYAADLRVSSSK